MLDGQDPTEMLVSQDADDVTLVTDKFTKRKFIIYLI